MVLCTRIMQYFHPSWKNFEKNAETFAQLPKMNEKLLLFSKKQCFCRFFICKACTFDIAAKNFCENSKQGRSESENNKKTLLFEEKKFYWTCCSRHLDWSSDNSVKSFANVSKEFRESPETIRKLSQLQKICFPQTGHLEWNFYRPVNIFCWISESFSLRVLKKSEK